MIRFASTASDSRVTQTDLISLPFIHGFLFLFTSPPSFHAFKPNISYLAYPKRRARDSGLHSSSLFGSGIPESEVRDRGVKQERKKDQFKDVILSWPTLPASKCSVTLSNGLPIKKREKKNVLSVGQCLPNRAF